jgi:outer membrane protein assembly factor BamD
MLFNFQPPKRALVAILSVGLLSSCIHKKYENPITKDTQQPDKILFDTAMKDIEHGRYEVARLSLQTLMNTYENSEFLAKAKLAVADSWYREGGGNGMAQAEAEYKDFILFYPNMEESAEAQNRVCDIHVKQMDKPDRDITQALRAEDECRQLLIQFPNSKFAPQAAQRVREIQEVLAGHEFGVGNFYWKHEMNPAAANRLNAMVDQWPLYSKADEALFEAGDAYSQMGPRFRKKSFEMWDRIVRDYPLGDRVNDAKKRLTDAEQPVPEPDPASLARMKYEQENYTGRGMMAKSMSWIHSAPDVTHAAKEGAPTMTDPKRTIPASIPLPAGTETEAGTGTGGASTDVSAQTLNGSSTALDNKADARSSGGTAVASSTPDASAQAQAQVPLPSNRDKELQRLRKKAQKKQASLEKKKKKQQPQSADQPSQPAAATSGTPVTNSAAPPASQPAPQQ